MMKAVLQSDFGQKSAGLRAPVVLSPQFQWNKDIFQGGQGGDELKVLKNETDHAVAQSGALIFVQETELLAGQPDPTFAGLVQSGTKSQQGGFAAAGGSDDGAGFPGMDAEIDGL